MSQCRLLKRGKKQHFLIFNCQSSEHSCITVLVVFKCKWHQGKQSSPLFNDLNRSLWATHRKIYNSLCTNTDHSVIFTATEPCVVCTDSYWPLHMCVLVVVLTLV